IHQHTDSMAFQFHILLRFIFIKTETVGKTAAAPACHADTQILLFRMLLILKHFPHFVAGSLGKMDHASSLLLQHELPFSYPLYRKKGYNQTPTPPDIESGSIYGQQPLRGSWMSIWGWCMSSGDGAHHPMDDSSGSIGCGARPIVG